MEQIEMPLQTVIVKLNIKVGSNPKIFWYMLFNISSMSINQLTFKGNFNPK